MERSAPHSFEALLQTQGGGFGEDAEKKVRLQTRQAGMLGGSMLSRCAECAGKAAG